MYHIYLLIDPRDNTPFYIGKGKGDRATNHFLWKSAKGGNVFKDRVIERIKEAGLLPIVEIHTKDVQDEAVAYAIEERLIRSYGRRGIEEGGCLTNICLETGKPPTRYGKENGFYGKHHSPENKKLFAEKARKQFTGKKLSPEQIAKSKANFDREAARQRLIIRNKSPTMKAKILAGNTRTNKIKLINKVITNNELYRNIVASCLAGCRMCDVRDEYKYDYMEIFKVYSQIEKYTQALWEIDHAQ